MATPKQAHTLASYYTKLYKEKYNFDPVVNRYSARWGFDSMLMDMGVEEAKKVIEYYFTTTGSHSHSLDWFFYNYDKLIASKKLSDKDREEQRIRREASRKRTEEWRNRISGKDRD